MCVHFNPQFGVGVPVELNLKSSEPKHKDPLWDLKLFFGTSENKRG